MPAHDLTTVDQAHESYWHPYWASDHENYWAWESSKMVVASTVNPSSNTTVVAGYNTKVVSRWLFLLQSHLPLF
jgi:hypothetical protein